LRLVGKQGSTNLLEVVVAGDGRLPFRSGIVRAISSLISIGTGASIGREGGITQLSATMASKWGQLARGNRTGCGCWWRAGRRRASPGLTTRRSPGRSSPRTSSWEIFHELVRSRSAPPSVSSMLSRSFFGIHPWYEVPNFDFTSIAQLPWFVVLGFFAGALGAGFLRLLQISKEMFQRIPLLYVRMAAGGLLVGVDHLRYPEVWGNGHEVTTQFIQHPISFDILLGIFLAKLVATVITVGSGAVGG
jgi:CIC family chloride channel protein